MKTTNKQFTCSSFVTESVCFTTPDEVDPNERSITLASRNKCHAASLSALRSFSAPFLRSTAPQLYRLPLRIARPFQRLKTV